MMHHPFCDAVAAATSDACSLTRTLCSYCRFPATAAGCMLLLLLFPVQALAHDEDSDVALKFLSKYWMKQGCLDQGISCFAPSLALAVDAAAAADDPVESFDRPADSDEIGERRSGDSGPFE